MKKELKSYSKKEAVEYIMKSFENDNLSKEKLKNLKVLAMSKNIKMGGMRKKFCKKCYSLFTTKNSEIRIKMPHKKIKCKNCGYIATYKIKKE
jgi:RNase P subunit RPR2